MTAPDPAPHAQAGFINALREEGTRDEICDQLQRTWNELMQARQAPASPAAPALHGTIPFTTIKALHDHLRAACRAEGSPRIQAAWDAWEPVADLALQRPAQGDRG